MNDTKKSFTNKEISEDEHKANESNVDELTKKMNTKIDDLIKAKTEEVMKV
jgi:ribosome recycling factor